MSQTQQVSEDIRSLLAAHRLAMTRPRAAFWSYMIDARRALTLPEIIAAMRDRGVGRATTYRCIDLFAGLGLLRQVKDVAGVTCFVLVHIGDGHPVICGRCHAVVEFRAAAEMHRLARLAERQTGYEVYGSDLAVFGLCEACRSPAG